MRGTRNLIWLVVLGLILPLAAMAADLKTLEKNLESEDEAERQAAYAELEALTGEELTKAIEAFEDLQKKRIKDFEKDYKKLHEIYPGYGKLGDKGMERVLKPWLMAREDACNWVFDEEAYPLPPGGRAGGPQKGYNEAMPRIRKARDIYSKQIEASAQRAAATVLKGKWNKGFDDLKAQAAVIAEAEEVLARVNTSHKAYEVGGFAFLDAMALLSERKFVEASKIYNSEFNDTQKALYFFVLSHIIEHYNLREIKTRMDGTSKKAVTAINKNRISLGVLPYEHDPELTNAITDHFADIKSGKTPFGHMSNVPGKRGVRDRAELAGWTGGAKENLSQGGAMESVDAWFWDGGHGRNEVSPKHEKIGFAHGGGCGFNNGYGEKCEVDRITPPWKFGRN